MNDHRFSRCRVMAAMEQVPRGEYGDGKSGTLLEVHEVGQRDGARLANSRVLGISAHTDVRDPRAWLDVRYVGRDSFYHASRFHAGDVRERRLDQVLAAEEKRIAEIDGDHVVFDQDGSGAKVGLRHLAQLHHFRAAELIE